MLSESCKDIAIDSFQLPPEKVQILFYQTDVISLTNNWNRNTEILYDTSYFRKILGVPNNKFLVAYIGRIDVVKGILILLKSVKKIVEKDKTNTENIKLIIKAVKDGHKGKLGKVEILK